jgi:hypothetical protein
MRIWRRLKEFMFTDIGGKFLLENPYWGKSQRSQCLKRRLRAFVFEESLYWQYFEQNHENLRALQCLLTCIPRKFLSAALSEEIHENIRWQEGVCVQW